MREKRKTGRNGRDVSRLCCFIAILMKQRLHQFGGRFYLKQSLMPILFNEYGQSFDSLSTPNRE
ncbi:hypothetical protein HMPREF0971_01859 [Segatella oris F0302]|uniref:Uncharacterized protein n=1 Tax=Segatella oris F0302 TaxID=649760 RepID=D1QSA2_9BACT|nr:hypothetical protein HMPREF0971_01859 [Segatella oris F0302]